MASAKMTISVMLMLLTLYNVKCQVQQENPLIMESLPAERLLRGSNEDRRPLGLVSPFDQTQERPMIFFNAEESRSVRMKDQDLIIDPVTGQTMIKHINEKNEEADYVIRPTDVAVKTLQGFYVAGDTTESEETSDVFEAATDESAGFTNSQPTDVIMEELKKLPPAPSSATLMTEAVSTHTVTEYQADTSTAAETTAEVTDMQTDKEETYRLKTTPNNSEDINNMEVEANNLQEDSTNSKNPLEVTATPTEAETEGISSRLGLPGSLAGPAVDAVGRSLNANKVSAVPLSAMSKSTEDQRPKVKLSKRDTLRSWLQDPWLRSPIGILVPLHPRSIGRALAVWNEITSPEGLNLTVVLLIGYHDSGIGWMSKHNLQNPDAINSVANALQRLLLKYQSYPPADKGTAALHACAWASRHVPYDSALFMITDAAPFDAHRLSAALRSVIDKRLKVYTIWTDPLYPSAGSDQAVADLKKVSKNTEGEFLDYHPAVTASNSAASSETPWDRNAFQRVKMEQSARTGRTDSGFRERHEILLVRRINGGGPTALGVPVEVGVESLRVRIDGRIDRAVLYPPTGWQIDLLNTTAVSGFSPGSRIESEAPLEAVLVFPPRQNTYNYAVVPAAEEGGAASHKKYTVGLWRLSVRCSGCEYRVLVTAHAPIGLDATVVAEDILQLRARGPIASIRETSLIDEYGMELAKLPFSHQPATKEEGLEENPRDINTPSLVADVPLPPVKRSSKVYAKVVGRDVYGESFTRVAGPIFKQEIRTSRSASISFPDERIETLQSTFSFPDDAREERARLLGYNETIAGVLTGSVATAQIASQEGTLLTAVQIGLSTRLYGAPGDSLQLHFEVTNYRERSVYFRFGATGNLRFLRGIRPNAQWINAGQTANVIVDVGITAGAQVGARDLITFNASAGTDQVSISAYVYVRSPEIQLLDTWAPILRHAYHGDCITKLGDDCSRHAWAATVYARDNDGGLLRLSSSPVGLRYDSTFTAGTREEVTATYRATCCAPRVLVTAVDANGNANTYTLDITYYIPAAAIAAIALGVLLFIALIALIVFLVVLCVRRRKESRQLPSYATRRDTT